MSLPRPQARRVRKLAGELHLPRPFTVRELCLQIGRDRGREIVLKALPMSAAGPCGLWLATGTTDFICYESETSRPHQRHIVLHELGHILCGHNGPQAPQHFPDSMASMLSPDTVRLMLSRQHSGYQEDHEAEAELFAYTLDGRIRKHSPLDDAAGAELDPFSRRILDLLGG